MKKMLLVFLLSYLTGTVAMAQQTPATAPKTTAPVSKTLTPAEQRQKEKIDREIQRNRQIRAEAAQKQREYEARQAEKERQRQAKKAAKEQPRETVKETPAPTAAPATQPGEPTPVPPTEPTRKERKQKRRKETVAEPAPIVTSPETTPSPTSVDTPKPARPERPRRQRERVVQVTDSAAIATGEPTAIRPRKEFLPKGHLFEPILLDPLEAQAYGSVLPVYVTNGEKYKGSIVPFAFGFAKPFYRRTTEPGHSEEWVLDVASFTQFEVYYDGVKDKQRRQIMNNDYKVSILYNIRRGANNYRFRAYHLSSHLGDDYVFRNQITAPSPNSVNYEVVDATYSRVNRDWRLYGGLGIGLRKSSERKRFSAQLGAFYKKPSEKFARLVGGVDVKFWQQTDFRPGIHGGIGFEVGRSQNNLTFLAEGYSGFRPYSQFEEQKTFWLGIGMYMNPF